MTARVLTEYMIRWERNGTTQQVIDSAYSLDSALQRASRGRGYEVTDGMEVTGLRAWEHRDGRWKRINREEAS